MNKLLLILLIALYFYMIISSISVLLKTGTYTFSFMDPGDGFIAGDRDILYLMIGQNYQNKKFSKISVKHLTKLPYEEIKPEACSTIISETHHLNLVKLLYTTMMLPASLQQIDVLSDGESTFTYV